MYYYGWADDRKKMAFNKVGQKGISVLFCEFIRPVVDETSGHFIYLTLKIIK